MSTQNLHLKMLKLLRKIKKKFCLWQATNLALLRKLLISYFVMIIQMLALTISKVEQTFDTKDKHVFDATRVKTALGM